MDEGTVENVLFSPRWFEILFIEIQVFEKGFWIGN